MARADLVGVGPGQDDRADARRRPAGVRRASFVPRQQLAHDRGALLGGLPLPVDGLGQALAQRRWWSTLAKPRSAKGSRRSRRTASSGEHAPERTSSSRRCRAGSSMMFTILPGMAADASPGIAPAGHVAIGFLGPAGTFTEEALLSEPDYAAADIVPLASLAEVLEAVDGAEVDLGFVPIENAIEGTVRDIIDSLVFDFDLLIQREVVLDVHLHLMARPGTSLGDIERVASIPVATAQCRRFLAEQLPRAEDAWPPTRRPRRPGCSARATRRLTDRPTAAIAPRLAAELYGLEILAEDVEDHPDNQTRFVAAGPDRASRRRPATTGPASSASRARTIPAASTPSSASSRPATST